MQRYIRMAGVDESGATEGPKFIPTDEAVMEKVVSIFDRKEKKMNDSNPQTGANPLLPKGFMESALRNSLPSCYGKIVRLSYLGGFRMKKVLMTNMSSKGQVVIPNEFRKSLGLTAGTPLAVYTDGSTLLLKQVEVPKADDFEKLLKESKKAAKAAGLKQSDIIKTIKKVRNEDRS